MAKVPDLGSDFAQKLLKDLRRRRERLGFESAAAQRGTANVAPRDAYSNSQKPLQIRKPQQVTAPRGGRAESTTNRSYRQGNNSTVGTRKPRNNGSPPIAHSQAIVPFQGRDSKPKPAANVDMQMALALALSNSGKLQNLQLVESNGGNYLLSPSAHFGKVAIGVQKLNDILMAYTSGAGGMRGFDKRGSVEVGKQLLRGAMDLEESLNMLMMLQDASDYMESSGNGKVLLLESNESRRSSPRSARLVEIVDEDSDAELGSDAKSPSDTSMQIVPIRKSQSSSANHRSALQLATVTNSSKSNVTSGERDDSKVRMPNLIAKLMGLENLPSAKVVAEGKATERFVRPHAVPRKGSTTTTNATFSTLPIRIVGSERVTSKGQIKNFLPREWNISLTKSEESGFANILSNRSSELTGDKQRRQTMRQMLSKQENTDRRVNVIEAVDEKIVHQGMKLTEEKKLQKTVGVGCRNDRKMNFLQRFTKNVKSKPVTEEKGITQGNDIKLGKMQATSINQTGIDREVKSRRTREKFNKENHSSAENKPEVRNGKTYQLGRQAQSKQTNKQIVDKRMQNYRQKQNETANQILGHRRLLKSETTYTKEKIEYTTPIQLNNGELTKMEDTAGHRPSYNTSRDDAMFRQSAEEMNDMSTTYGVSSNQLHEEIKDPTTAVGQTSAGSTAETTVSSVDQIAREAAQTVEIFSEKQQLQQTKIVDDPLRNDFDHILKSDNLTNLKSHKIDAVSYDSFTETQLLLKEMLLKDHYLLETAKSITRIHVPVSVVHVNTGKWLDTGNRVLSDIGREVIRRKGKRAEAMADVSPPMLRLQSLDDLIRELDADIQSLDIPNMKPHQQSANNPAENLKMVLHSDIDNAHPDANSVWDFGWNRIRNLPIEKNEVIKDLEKNILGGIITDVARELIDVSRCHGCWCACEA